MGFTYEQRKRSHTKDINLLRADTTYNSLPAAPQTSHRAISAPASSFDLDGAMRERMINTFGDLSAVQDYTPPARTQAPALTGPYTGPVTHAISNASPSPAAAGPMQAKRRDADAKHVKEMGNVDIKQDENFALPGSEGYNELSSDEWETKTHTPGFSKLWGKKDQTFKVRRNRVVADPIKNSEIGPLRTDNTTIMNKKLAVEDPFDVYLNNVMASNRTPNTLKGQENTINRLYKKYTGPAYKRGAFEQRLHRPKSALNKEDQAANIEGLDASRVLTFLIGDRGRGFSMKDDEIEALMDQLMAPHRENMSAEEQEAANEQFDQGVMTYKVELSRKVEPENTQKRYGCEICRRSGA